MGCADPPSKGVGAPHQCSRVNEQRSGWGGVVTGPAQHHGYAPRLTDVLRREHFAGQLGCIDRFNIQASILVRTRQAHRQNGIVAVVSMTCVREKRLF